jgi:uncharacterized membrane protein YvbJ
VKCPHCEKEIPGTTCPDCGVVNPEEAKFCMECGVSLRENAEEDAEETTFEAENGFDLDDRILCPDGTCTGIIVDGKCTECGKTLEEAKKAAEESMTEEKPDV